MAANRNPIRLCNRLARGFFSSRKTQSIIEVKSRLVWRASDPEGAINSRCITNGLRRLMRCDLHTSERAVRIFISRSFFLFVNLTIGSSLFRSDCLDIRALSPRGFPFDIYGRFESIYSRIRFVPIQCFAYNVASFFYLSSFLDFRPV